MTLVILKNRKKKTLITNIIVNSKIYNSKFVIVFKKLPNLWSLKFTKIKKDNRIKNKCSLDFFEESTLEIDSPIEKYLLKCSFLNRSKLFIYDNSV